MVFKALLHWRSFEAGRTNTFDHVVFVLQQAPKQQAGTAALCYWLSNTVTLHYLVDQIPTTIVAPEPSQPFSFPFFSNQKQTNTTERMDLVQFKSQLWATLERLYVTIRDSVKAELADCLSGTTSVSMTSGGVSPAPASKPSRASQQKQMLRFTSTLRAKVSDNWIELLHCLKNVFEELRNKHTPPLLVYYLLQQLLKFVDVKVVNSLIMRSRWCPCTYSNGVILREALSRLQDWLDDDVDVWLHSHPVPYLAPLAAQLVQMEQAATFLVLEDKSERTIDDIRQLCPNLSMSQLVHISIAYEDDKHHFGGVDPSVIEVMWAMSAEKSPLRLKDDDSIPFSLNEILQSMEDFDVNEVQPPVELLKLGLQFLLSDTLSWSTW